MSGKTIYNYIGFHLKGGLKKLALSELRQKGKKRRKSRFVQIDLLETYNAQAARETIERRFKRLGSGLVKTIRFDQGKKQRA
jgi:IS30 family transposase